MADIIVNLADESITDLHNAVVVQDWDQGDLDNEDMSSTPTRTASRWRTAGLRAEGRSQLVHGGGRRRMDDPTDPDQALEAEQEQKQEAAGPSGRLILKARMV